MQPTICLITRMAQRRKPEVFGSSSRSSWSLCNVWHKFHGQSMPWLLLHFIRKHGCACSYMAMILQCHDNVFTMMVGVPWKTLLSKPTNTKSKTKTLHQPCTKSTTIQAVFCNMLTPRVLSQIVFGNPNKMILMMSFLIPTYSPKTFQHNTCT